MNTFDQLAKYERMRVEAEQMRSAWKSVGMLGLCLIVGCALWAIIVVCAS